MELGLGAVGRDLVVVEFYQLVFGKEDDRFLDDFELRLHLAYLGVLSVAVADSPAEKPLEVEVMFLDSVLTHLAGGAQIADEFVYALVVEMVELNPFALGFEVLAEGTPLFHRSGSPLAVDALLFDEAVKEGEDIFGLLDRNHAVDGILQLLL